MPGAGFKKLKMFCPRDQPLQRQGIRLADGPASLRKPDGATENEAKRHNAQKTTGGLTKCVHGAASHPRAPEVTAQRAPPTEADPA